jgi:DNA-3-methyladenine glycosylase II
VTAAAPKEAAAAASLPSPVITPDYWKDACRALSRSDRILRRLIPRYGDARLESRGDPFITLARSIVGQQISVKAAASVWERFACLVETITPPAILRLEVATLRSAGLSLRKSEYLLDLSRHFDSTGIAVGHWDAMEDEAVIAELVTIRGIGRWTAEMFLMFHLLRPNVLPLDDIGLLKGISTNYLSGEPVSRSEAREVGAAWAPWRSVATWYMWRSLDPMAITY